MGQFKKLLLALDKAHRVPERVMDCRAGLACHDDI